MTSIEYLRYLIILLIKLETASLPKYDLKGLLSLSPTHTNL